MRALIGVFIIIAFTFALHLTTGVPLPGDVVFGYILNPEDYANVGMEALLLDLFQLSNLAGVITIGGVLFGSQNVTYAGAALSIWTWGTVFLNGFTSLVNSFIPVTGDIATARFLVATMFGVILLTWMWVIIEWARGRD